MKHIKKQIGLGLKEHRVAKIHSYTEQSIPLAPTESYIDVPWQWEERKEYVERKPPKYSSGIHYENKRNLIKALKILQRPLTNKEVWIHAYRLASTAIASAHRLTPRNSSLAYENSGVVAIGATRAIQQLKNGGRI